MKKSDAVVNKTFVRMMEELGYDIEISVVVDGEAEEQEVQEENVDE